MKMSTRRGSRFVPDPARGIVEREDLDQKCHVELDEEINSYLGRHATKDPRNVVDLKLVAVDPDGIRKASRDALCFWHPKALALSLRDRLLFPETGSDEDKRRQLYQEIKDFRKMAYAMILKEEDEIKERARREAEAAQQQFAWEEMLMKKDC